MKKCITLLVLFSMLSSSNFSFCMSGSSDDVIYDENGVPTYYIGVSLPSSGEPKKVDTTASEKAEREWDMPTSTTGDDVVYGDDQEKGVVAKIVDFLKRNLPSGRKVKCACKKIAKYGAIVGAAVLSAYALVKAGAKVREVIKRNVRGISSAARLTLLCSLGFFSYLADANRYPKNNNYSKAKNNHLEANNNCSKDDESLEDNNNCFQEGDNNH